MSDPVSDRRAQLAEQLRKLEDRDLAEHVGYGRWFMKHAYAWVAVIVGLGFFIAFLLGVPEIPGAGAALAFVLAIAGALWVIELRRRRNRDVEHSVKRRDWIKQLRAELDELDRSSAP